MQTYVGPIGRPSPLFYTALILARVHLYHAVWSEWIHKFAFKLIGVNMCYKER